MSVKIERILSKLKTAQAEWANQVLAGSTGRDAYEFGRVSGVYQGLLRAEKMITDIIGEADDRKGTTNLDPK